MEDSPASNTRKKSTKVKDNVKEVGASKLLQDKNSTVIDPTVAIKLKRRARKLSESDKVLRQNKTSPEEKKKTRRKSVSCGSLSLNKDSQGACAKTQSTVTVTTRVRDKHGNSECVNIPDESDGMIIQKRNQEDAKIGEEDHTVGSNKVSEIKVIKGVNVETDVSVVIGCDKEKQTIDVINKQKSEIQQREVVANVTSKDKGTINREEINTDSITPEKMAGTQGKGGKEETTGGVPEKEITNAQIWEMLHAVSGKIDSHKNDITVDIQSLRNDIRATNTKLQNIEMWKTQVDEKIGEMEDALKFADKTIEDTKAADLEKKVNAISKMLSRHWDLINEIQDRTDNMEARSMKNNVIISGIEENVDESCTNKVNSFVANELELGEQLNFKVAHRIGNGKGDRPMVVRLKNQDEKSKIFKNVKSLSKKVNYNDRPYFVNDQLPAKINERKMWEKDIFRRNKKKSVAAQLTMSFKKGKLSINGEPYRPKVEVPKLQDILMADEDEKRKWAECKCVAGKEITKGNCHFYGFTRAIGSHYEIRMAYNYLKYKYGNARHIVCAYRLPGILPTDEGYEDDDEYGSGRKLLAVMRNAHVVNRVFFVIRFYGGSHIGAMRFQGYREAMESALLHNAFNTVTKMVDTLDSKEEDEYENSRPGYSARGGRGYRGHSPRNRDDRFYDSKKRRNRPTEQEWQEFMKEKFSAETLEKIKNMEEAEMYQKQVLTVPTKPVLVDEDGEIQFKAAAHHEKLTPISEQATNIVQAMNSMSASWASPPLEGAVGITQIV